jgi:3-oxoadipate enol-lactonase
MRAHRRSFNLRPTFSIAAPIAMAPPQLLTLPDTRVLEFALSAEPTGGPIVLLSNSLCAPFGVWAHVVDELHAKGFRTLRYNHPGHHRSSAPNNLDTTFNSLADDVYFLLRELDIRKLYAWIGISMGAAAGIVFVAKYPGIVEKFVICDTISCSAINAGIGDVFGPRVAAAREAGNMTAAIDGTMERWFGKEWLQSNIEEAQRVRDLMKTTTIDGFATCVHALQSESFDLRPLFIKVGAGVDDALLVVGEKDANLPQTMAEMRDKINEGFKDVEKDKVAELVIIKNAGHVSFIDGFDQFCEVVLRFLQP